MSEIIKVFSEKIAEDATKAVKEGKVSDPDALLATADMVSNLKMASTILRQAMHGLSLQFGETIASVVTTDYFVSMFTSALYFPGNQEHHTDELLANMFIVGMEAYGVKVTLNKNYTMSKHLRDKQIEDLKEALDQGTHDEETLELIRKGIELYESMKVYE